MQRLQRRIVWATILMLSVVLLCSCGGKKVVEENPFKMDQPVSKSFENILFYPFETNAEIQKYYPKAMEESLQSTIKHLQDKKKYRKIDRINDNFDKESTLLVQVKVPDMRIVGNLTRAFGGAIVGSSYMNMEVYLIDAASGDTVRMKALASANNAMGATWTFGSTDRTLPADMGYILAQYIATVVPAR